MFVSFESTGTSLRYGGRFDLTVSQRSTGM
jgi:hypothetical protein